MTKKPRSLFLVHLLMVVCATLVSTSFTVCAVLSHALDPLVLTFIRFITASLLLLPVVIVRFELRLSASLFIRSSVISSCLVLFFWCMFLSLRYTTALNTSVIFAIVPVISWVYSMILLRERIGRAQSIALFLGMAGAVWVIFRGNPFHLTGMELNRGDLIFLAGCFAMGLYTPLIKLLYRGEPMLVLTFWILVTGTGWLGLFGAGKIMTTGWFTIPLTIWSWVLYLAFFTTVVTFFLTQYCIMFIGPTRAMAYSYLYPCLVLLQDLALGKGMPPAAIIPGVVIVLAAMVVLQCSIRGLDEKREV